MDSAEVRVSSDVVTTGVDQLINFLQGKDKVPLLDAATALKVKPETVQAWVDFLVEEGLVGIEYKFTKPFIYMNRPDQDRAKTERTGDFTWDVFHKAFLENAHAKGIPPIEAATLWKNHVLGLIEQKRVFFLDEARKRGLEKAENVWEEYKLSVLMKI